MTLPFSRASRAPTPCLRALRSFSSTRARPTPRIPYTATCPAPTCACGATPRGLDIDRTTPLLHTMAPYAEQVLLCTGAGDWRSNLEDDGAAGEFVRGLKREIGKGAPGFDVCVLVG